MKNISYPDIFIIVTDSARAYNSNSDDDREKPTYYDSLENFVYCTNAYTSAPSSVMSGAAMISSLDSYMVSRNYDNFRFNNSFDINNIDTITQFGYKTQGFFVARELREKIGKLVGLDNKNKLSSQNFYDRMWCNSDLNGVVDKYLNDNSKSEKPLFNLIWNNIRHDYKISDHLKDLENIIKKYNRWDDSIIFILSDHGYPAKDKGITPEGLKRDNKTHDLWMTEDNVRIPFYFKTPKDKSFKISKNVSTIDIFPTIFDLIGKKPKLKFSNGVSLSSNNNKRDEQLSGRFLRVDSRFIGQPMRKTAILYQNNKLVKNHDDNLISLFKLDKNDITFEEEINDKKLLTKMTKAYIRNEQNALRFQYSTQLNLAKNRYRRFVLGNFDKSLIEYLKFEKINYIGFNRLSGFEKFKLLFNRNACFINVPRYNKTTLRFIRIVSKKFIYVNLVSDQEVIKWGFKRLYLAIKNTLPFVINEPKYLYVRIKEFVK